MMKILEIVFDAIDDKDDDSGNDKIRIKDNHSHDD